jgi:hypothetical protein
MQSLKMPQDPHRYVVSALAMGAISNLEFLICKIGGGIIDRRSYCEVLIDELSEEFVYVPSDLRVTLEHSMVHIRKHVMNLENLDNLSFSDSDTLSLTTSRDALFLSSSIEMIFNEINKMLLKNMETIKFDSLMAMTDKIKKLTTFIKNVPSHLDTNISRNIVRYL